MPESRVISTSQPADTVTFTVLSEGEAIPRTISVQSIAIWQEVNRVPIAKLTILDGSPAQQTFSVSDQDLFLPGKAIEIKAGYHSDEATIFRGIVTRHRIKVRSNGANALIVECGHEVIKMTQVPTSRYFYDATESDIWEELLDNYDLQGDIPATSFTHHQLLQFQSTDWDFLVARAEMNGRFVIAEPQEVHIKAPDFGQDITQAVTFGATLLSLDAEIDAATQLAAVHSRTWDFSKTENTEVQASSATPVTPGNLQATDLADVFGGNELFLRNSAKQADELLQAWADATLLRHELAKVRGRAQFQGIPEISAGKIIELHGIGERFNGRAFVSGVRHNISQGNWLVDVQFGLSPEPFARQFPISQTPAAGLAPAVHGLQIGVVTQLQDDPEADERVQVNIPVVNADEQGVWARLGTVGAGGERGFVFRPEIGDEVVVGFVNGDPSHPVILGSLHSSNLPAPIAASDDNHEKGWITRGEVELRLNDDEPSVLVKLPSGRTIELSDDAEHIEIKDDTGNTIRLDSDGITIESASDIVLKATGDINLEAMNLNSTTQVGTKLESSATAELSASGSTTIRGGIVQIN